MAQTIIQNERAIRAGSIKAEVSLDKNTWVDLGALRNVGGIEATGTNATIEFDNVDEITKYKKGNKFKMVAELCEINWTNVALINGGQVVVNNVAGTLVAGAEQTIKAGFNTNEVIALTFKNADGTQPTINSVMQGATALVLGTDYNIISTGNGYAIIFDTSVATTSDIVVDMDYTPTAKKEVTFNATGIKSKHYLRLTNVDDLGKEHIMHFSGAVNIVPVSIDFAGDNEDEIAKMPIELEGTLDLIEDEQVIS
jgi:uncharacterized protein YuzE